jgi:alpha-amylase
MQTVSQHKTRQAAVLLSREGRVMQGNDCIPVFLTKKLTFPSGDLSLKVEYEVRNDGTQLLDARFLSEWNLTLLAGDSPDRSYFIDGKKLDDPRLCVRGEDESVSRAGMLDRWLGLNVAFQTPSPARYPVETVSNSEGGFERVYQGSCILWGWDLHLAPDETAKFELNFHLEDLQR